MLTSSVTQKGDTIAHFPLWRRTGLSFVRTKDRGCIRKFQPRNSSSREMALRKPPSEICRSRTYLITASQ